MRVSGGMAGVCFCLIDSRRRDSLSSLSGSSSSVWLLGFSVYRILSLFPLNIIFHRVLIARHFLSFPSPYSSLRRAPPHVFFSSAKTFPISFLMTSSTSVCKIIIASCYKCVRYQLHILRRLSLSNVVGPPVTDAHLFMIFPTHFCMDIVSGSVEAEDFVFLLTRGNLECDVPPFSKSRVTL